MRSITKAEAEKNLTAVLSAAAKEPVRIRSGERDVIVVSAEEFEEARQVLHDKRMRALRRARLRANSEAAANGFKEAKLPEFLAR